MAVFGSIALRPAEDRPFASPFPRGPDSDPAAGANAAADAAPRIVLLIEDNPTDVFVIKNVVKESGLNLDLRVVGDGHDALRYFEDLAGSDNPCCPALVLLDLNLPKVAGV